MTDKVPYGYCPKCGVPGQQRERRPNGDDICARGCKYPSRDSLPEPIEPIDYDEFLKKRAMPFSKPAPCTSVEHNAPTHLYVPPGEIYVHECPECGKRSAIAPPNITFSEIEDEDAFAAESDNEILDKLGR